MFLLDTNIVSELRKARAGKADPGVVAWARTVAADSLFLSAIVIEELELGVLLAERRHGPTGAVLRTWLQNQVLRVFADRILPVDTAVALRSAAFHVPQPRPVRDALIGATARVHGLTMVTRNVNDFRPVVASLLNPWDWARREV